jgi:hypothetical protein
MLEEERAMNGVVERLHALLVDAVRVRRGGEAGAAAVSVAEIYQDLVPYRAVRVPLGLDMNADYEHVLLRLLSGESGLARLEPPTAREQLRDELDSPNPNVTLYRKFAGCDVWLAAPVTTPDWVPPEAEDARAEAWDGIEPDAGLPEPAHAPAADAVPEEDPAVESALPASPARPFSGVGLAAARAGRCLFCDSNLPPGRAIRFCPFCGADQTLRPCAACGEPVEPEWAFCIACGAPAESA